MKLSPRSLVTRVALTTASTVIVASACVALISQLIADRMAAAREDSTLSDAAETLAFELERPGSDPRAVTEDETRELAHAEILFAVFDGAARIAGDPRLARVAPGACRDVDELRICARPAHAWLAVAARGQRDLRGQQSRLLYASALAVLLTSLLGAFAAVVIARVVISPLARLRSAVESVPAHDPGAVTLGVPSGLVEVDSLRDSLRAAFVRLAAALAQSRRFASDAAHELRTPLATLIGELELTAEQLDDSAQEQVVHALKLARRMSTLVDRLLILARLDAIQDRERLVVRELVEEAIEMLAPALRDRVSIESSPESDVAEVDGDQVLLLASFYNALENALKFSDERVHVTIDVDASSVKVSIIDLGPGIDETERELVFSAFYRTAASRSSAVPGHGIGLALIAHVLSLHGGTARFADCDSGAKLELVLPVARS